MQSLLHCLDQKAAAQATMDKVGVGGMQPPPPLLAFNHFMRTQISKYQSDLKLKPAEALVLGKNIATLRSTTQRTTGGDEALVAFWGFAEVKERNLMLRNIQYAIKPRVAYASQKTNQGSDTHQGSYFEGIFVFPSARINTEQLENLFDRFRMSIGVAELDAFMSDSMISCINRIRNGSYEWGNWYSSSNHWYRVTHARMAAKMAENESIQNLQAVTGLTFSTGNMLGLFHARQNLQIEMQEIIYSLSALRGMIVRDSSNLGDTMMLAISIPGMHGHLMRTSINEQLDYNVQMTDFAERLVVRSVATQNFASQPPPPPAGPAPVTVVIDLT